MDIGPFNFGNTVSTSHFTNRELEMKQLKNNLTSGINTIIISPRRWGKSSLVERVLLDFEKNGKIKTVSLDLFSCSSETEFLELFARKVIQASSSDWEDWVGIAKSFFKKLVPKLNIDLTSYIDFTLEFDPSELSKHKDEILNLPEEIAKKKQIQFIIAIDEFQNLASFSNYTEIEKTMRACWQRHKQATYCLYGSKRDMLSDIFNNSSKPFYRFGDILLLPKIKREKWINYIVERFIQTKKSISPEMAGQIADLMDNHSWYVQQLSHYTWHNSKKSASEQNLYDALLEVIHANSPLFQREIEFLSSTQVNLLKAIARQEKQLSSQATLKKYNLGTSANVVKNKQVLLNAELIDIQGGIVTFLDPVFERWFKHHFTGAELIPTFNNK